MNKFCKNGSVYEDSMSFIKSTSELAEVDVTLQKTQKSAKNIDIGTKTKLLLIEWSLSDAESSFSEENAWTFMLQLNVSARQFTIQSVTDQTCSILTPWEKKW